MTKQPRLKETKALHFDLSHYPNHDDFTLHVGVRKHPLRAHSHETRAAATGSSRLLGLVAPGGSRTSSRAWSCPPTSRSCSA